MSTRHAPVRGRTDGAEGRSAAQSPKAAPNDVFARRLSEPETAAVEEHLLVCEDCRDSLQSIDDFLSAARAAPVKNSDLIKPD